MRRSEMGMFLEPRHGRKQVNTHAWVCLERCRQKLGLPEIPLPVPVEDWIEGPLGITFGFSDLSRLGEDVLGAVFMTEREIVIDERVLRHEGRMRFTCAHELGHLVLHGKVRESFQDLDREDPFDDKNIYERQADGFAAAFLMPIPLLEHELVALIDEQGLKRGEAIVQLTQPTTESEWLWRKAVLPRITRRFAVSWTAAIYRFHEIQTRTSLAWPLLPVELVDTLAKSAKDSVRLDSVWMENGRLTSRNLFDSNEASEV